MNFDFIEGLTKEQIEELYSEMAKNGEAELLSGGYYFTWCDNGNQGFIYETGYYGALGALYYNAGYTCVKYAPGIGYACYVCGNGNYGHHLKVGEYQGRAYVNICPNGSGFKTC